MEKQCLLKCCWVILFYCVKIAVTIPLKQDNKVQGKYSKLIFDFILVYRSVMGCQIIHFFLVLLGCWAVLAAFPGTKDGEIL